MTAAIDTERWLPVVGHENAYEVSTSLRVRSLERNVIRRNGCPMRVREHIRRPVFVKGVPCLLLYRNGKPIHRTISSLLREAQEADNR